MDIAIEAKGVGKQYDSKPRTLFARLGGLMRRGHATSGSNGQWAVRDLNVRVPRGKSVAFIGPNGSGKSTMLGLIAGTITPTEGTIRTAGRISSLLELGAGFHPQMTGRQNIYLSAAIQGIPKGVIEGKIARMLDFAGPEVTRKIDDPVKTYSSGMYLRLAFAVSIEVEPDILLVDEALAVGDVVFHHKCLDRIRDFQRLGGTLVLVTHDLGLVEQFCDEAKFLHHGKLIAEGDPSSVILTYLREYARGMRIGDLNFEENGNREIEFTRVVLLDERGRESATFRSVEPMQVELHYRAKHRIEKPVFGFGIKTAGGLHVFGTNTQLCGVDLPFVQGTGCVRLRIQPLPLLQGKYLMSVAAHSLDHRVQYHRIEDSIPLSVENTTGEHGLFRLPCSWSHKPGSPS